MGVFRQFPYSNFHEMNMDEIIKIIKNMLEEWARYHAEWDQWMADLEASWTEYQDDVNAQWTAYQNTMNTAWQSMQNFINNYFDNLDVQEEINNKIVSMIQTGEFGLLVNEYIPPAVNAWLNLNITQPTGVVIDTSLTVSGACADAKATGDRIVELTSFSAELKSGYIGYITGAIVPSETRHYTEFPVAEGMNILYRFAEGAIYNFGLAFYDESDKFIEGHIVIDNTTQEIPVPENAIKCRATANTIWDAVPRYYNESISISALRSTKSLYMDSSLYNFIPNKYAFSTTNQIAPYTSDDTNVMEFSVFPDMVFEYSYPLHLSDWAGLHFIDAAGSFISGVTATGSPITITVPASAVMCRATVKYRSDIKFENLGNTIVDAISNSGDEIAGITATAEPLQTITDETGMLDLFLKVGCIGDSLASGEAYWNDGGATQGHDFYEYSWGQFLERKTGNEYYNWSSGGQTTKSWLTSSYATECYDGNHKCQAYIIGLGQNDANNNDTIGTSADIDLSDYTNNADTFYGNYGKIIQKIKEIQPQAKIFVITDPSDSTDTKGYNTAIRAMATIFTNVYVVDMRTYGLKYCKSSVLLAQERAGHYNAYGYKVFSMMIANYIDWIITTNYTEFTQIELIGTGHSWTN